MFTDKAAAFFTSNFTVHTLKLLIILWSIIVIIATIVIDNPIALGILLAYEVLP